MKPRQVFGALLGGLSVNWYCGRNGLLTAFNEKTTFFAYLQKLNDIVELTQNSDLIYTESSLWTEVL